MKRTLSFILVLMLAVSMFAGCSDTTTPSASPSAPADSTSPSPAETPSEAPSEAPSEQPVADSKGLKVAVLTGSLTATPFCVSMGEEIDSQMKAQGWELSVFDADMDATKQSTQFETALLMEPDVIVYWCRDSAAAVEDVKKAAAANIPVITLNNDIAEEGWQYVTCFVGPNQYALGYDLGAYLVEKTDSANIAIIDGLANNTTYTARYQGFMDAIEGNDAYQVLVHDYCNADRTNAQTMTENYITGFDNLDTVVAFSDNFAIGSINAIQAAGKEGINVLSIDGMQIGFDEVAKGTMMATILQTPGYQITKVIEIINDVVVGGGTVAEHHQYSEHYIIDKDTMSQHEAAY